LVVLDSPEQRSSKPLQQLVAKINVCLKTWTNVVRNLYVHSSAAKVDVVSMSA
jgi:hypothetical protein